MEGQIQQVEHLKETLQKEVDTFHRFIDLERKLNEEILEKNFQHIPPTVKSLKTIAKELIALEEKRETIYRKLKEVWGVKEGESFYDFCFRFTGETREELLRWHRELKHAVVMVEGITSGIDVYCASTLSTMGKYMDALVPGWKHRVYSPKGVTTEPAQPLLVNQEL